MRLPPTLEGRWRITDQGITQQLSQLLNLVLDPDRAHLRLLGLLLLVRSLPLALLPLAGRLNCFAFPLRLTRPLLLGPLQSLLLPLVLASSAATPLCHLLTPPLA
ncbi:hypothetical protein AB0465_23295 [Streptomyces griseoviridis]|uniref:hypothetical protein n=1 Tax=Streptomyces griseoviridis TaxID=45398 RepID=UPI00344C4221